MLRDAEQVYTHTHMCAFEDFRLFWFAQVQFRLHAESSKVSNMLAFRKEAGGVDRFSLRSGATSERKSNFLANALAMLGVDRFSLRTRATWDWVKNIVDPQPHLL